MDSDREFRLTDRHARQFSGYAGPDPVFLGGYLHIDSFGDGRYFVSDEPAGGDHRVYVSRTELVEAARSILRHFGEA